MVTCKEETEHYYKACGWSNSDKWPLIREQLDKCKRKLYLKTVDYESVI